jgi:hypothetical protein
VDVDRRALIATGYALAPVGGGGFGLADGARRQLARLVRALDGSRDLVIDLAEGRVPDIVVRVLDRAVTVEDEASLECLRQSLDAIGGEGRATWGAPRPHRHKRGPLKEKRLQHPSPAVLAPIAIP